MKAIASNGMEINTGDAILVRNNTNECWTYAHFSHYDKSYCYPFLTVLGAFNFCIPYKGNEHLVGTASSYEFRFGAKVKFVYDEEEKVGVLLKYDKEDENDRIPYYVAYPIIGTTKSDTCWVSSVIYID